MNEVPVHCIDYLKNLKSPDLEAHSHVLSQEEIDHLKTFIDLANTGKPYDSNLSLSENEINIVGTALRQKFNYNNGDILTEKEIDDLLDAINSPMKYEDDLSKDPQKDLFLGAKKQGQYRKIRIYDPARPDRFTKKEMRDVSILHERFARHLSNYFSKTFDQALTIHFHVSSVDQLTFEEYTRSIPTPCVMCEAGSIINGHKSIIFNDIDTYVSNVLYMMSLGIAPEYWEEAKLPIFSSLIDPWYVKLLFDINQLLADSWRMLYPESPPYTNKMYQTNFIPQEIVRSPVELLFRMSPVEIGCLVCLEVSIHQANNETHEGLFNCFYPLPSLKPFLRDSEKVAVSLFIPREPEVQYPEYERNTRIKDEVKLDVTFIVQDFEMTLAKIKQIKAEDFWPITQDGIFKTSLGTKVGQISYQVHNKKETLKIIDKEYMMDQNKNETIDDILIKVSVELGNTQMTVKECEKLGEGHILTFDTLVGEPLNIFANNVKIARGEIIVNDEYMGVRVTEVFK